MNENPIMTMMFGTTGLIIAVALYVIFAMPLYTMAQKTDNPNPWFAFVPILNVVLMVQIAGKEWWWAILFFIPCINIVAAVIIWMGIAEAMGKPNWIGILMLVPIANIIVPFYLAYA